MDGDRPDEGGGIADVSPDHNGASGQTEFAPWVWVVVILVALGLLTLISLIARG